MLLLGLTESNATLDNQSNDINEISFYGEPHYSTLINIGDPHVDGGDKFRIEIFISGAGDVDLSKILIDVPRVVTKNGKVKLTALNYQTIDPDNRTVHGAIDVKDEESRFYLFLPSIWYMLIAEDGDYLSPKPQIFGESAYIINGTYYAPYTIDFVVNDKASAGDYDIHIDYMYKSSGKWYQDSKIIKLHVNNWYERDYWQTILQLGALLGILLTIVLILKEVWTFFCWDHHESQ